MADATIPRDPNWEKQRLNSRMAALLANMGFSRTPEATENLKSLYDSIPIDTSRRQIRLLTLLPASLTGYVECTLASTSLPPLPSASPSSTTSPRDVTSGQPCPSYEALSYTWTEGPGRPIKINGTRVSVSGSLEETLFRLQTREPRTLWIDAVCIDQTNIPERNAQVALMRDVYMSATGTIVWLGNNNAFGDQEKSYDRETDECMAVIDEWYTHLKEQETKLMKGKAKLHDVKDAQQFKDVKDMPPMEKRADDPPIGEQAPLTGEESESHTIKQDDQSAATAQVEVPGIGERDRLIDEADMPALGTGYDKLHKAFSIMASKRWWRRVWVVQEIAVSPRAIVGCSHSWTDWAPFERYSLWIRQAQKTPWHTEFTTFHQMVDIRRRYRAHGDTSLQTLLRETARFDATDPRDKIYALLGLATDADRQAVVPDYECDVPGLYVDVARHIIANERSLSLLALAGMNTLAGLPSWATDFRAAAYTRERMRYPLETTHRASSSRPPVVAFNDTTGLSIEGIIVDSLAITVPLHAVHHPGIEILQFSANSPPPHLDFLEEIAVQAYHIYLPAVDPRRDLSRALDDLWRVLILNRGHKGMIPASRDFERMYEAIRGWVELPEGFNAEYIEHLGPNDPDRKAFENALFVSNMFRDAGHAQAAVWTPPPRGTLEYVHNAFYAREGRRFFATACGFLGMGPNEARAGDVVAIVMGCHVPIVLREVDPLEEREEKHEDGDEEKEQEKEHEKENEDADDEAERRGNEERKREYIVVGECYVHGIMDGEVVDVLEARGERDNFAVETLRLR